jgi:hypothetical protein
MHSLTRDPLVWVLLVLDDWGQAWSGAASGGESYRCWPTSMRLPSGSVKTKPRSPWSASRRPLPCLFDYECHDGSALPGGHEAAVESWSRPRINFSKCLANLLYLG